MQKFGFKNKNAIKQNTALNKKGGSFFYFAPSKSSGSKFLKQLSFSCPV